MSTLYAIRDTFEPSPRNYVHRTLAKWLYCDLKKATFWKSRSAAERNLEAVRRSLRTFRPDLEIVEIPEKKYQKMTKGRFSEGDKVICAVFLSQITSPEPFSTKELTITKETPYTYTTNDGSIWPKDKINQLTAWGKFLLSNEEEVGFIKDMRTKEIVMNRLKTTDPRKRELWQQILISLDEVEN